jgi:UTP:GlnB (protein PII) uridylyltransferase
MELRVAGADVCAGLAMLDARHIAGDEQLSARLIEGVLTFVQVLQFRPTLLAWTDSGLTLTGS